MIRHLGTFAVLLVFSFLAALPTARADYSDDFESYTLGNIHGQGPWVDFGGTLTSDVSNAQAFSGTQSLAMSINPADPNGYGSDVYIVNVNGAPVTSGEWSLSYQVYVPTGFNGRGFMYLSQGAMPGDFREGSFLRADNNGGVGQFANQAGGQTPLVFDQWAKVEALLNLDANTLDVSYNGVAFHSGVWDVTNSGAPSLGGLNAWSTEGTAGTVYIDDLNLQQIPEPSSLLLAAVGLASLGWFGWRGRMRHR